MLQDEDSALDGDPQPQRVLVVDDDEGLRNLLRRYLSEQGFTVDAVTDGQALDAQLAESSPDLLILDLMLPGEDGLSIARRLRGRVPIIMVSARGDDIDRIVGLEVGADDYLAKPFNPRELLARIRAVLRRHSPEPGPEAGESVRRFGPYEALLATAEPSRRYVERLIAEINRRLGQPVPVHTTLNPEWHWADIPLAAETIRIGFAHERIGASPVTAALLLLLLIMLVSILAALVLARSFSRPLETLATAAQHVGAGQTPEPLPETGPRELAELSRRFNRMAADVRELMRNRTTLLSGISHDLRTPLARMRLALEMLPANTEPELAASLQRDVADMERLTTL